MKKLGWALALCAVAGFVAADDLNERAMRLHRSAIVVDTHEDVPESLEGEWKDLAVRNTIGHTDIPRWREGGVTAPFLAAYVNADYAKSGGSAKKALEFIDLIHRHRRRAPEGPRLRRLGRGDPPGQEGRQDRDPDRHRGRPRDRGLARRAVGVLPPRRALHDADAHEHEQLGRLLGQLLPPGLRSRRSTPCTAASRTSAARSSSR